MYYRDTITAVATPSGPGGIGIVKTSGPQALSIAVSIFRSKAFDPRTLQSHRLYYGTIIDPRDGCPLDEALVAYMRAPSTYTGEDVVEINSHSGYAVLQHILDLCLHYGARLAEPGEFTRRAFLNGRIDLTQAEAVAGVIEARTAQGLKIATRHLNGQLGARLAEVKQALVEVRSDVEASIDFPDDVEICSEADLHRKVSEAAESILALIRSYTEGSLYCSGVQAVITGRPNVGKSSILNTLLGDERAIVTPLAGTTRDIIHETITVRGIPVTLYDTAGLRHSDDEIEKIGIDMTLSKISESDLVLFILDGSCDIDQLDRSIAEKLHSCSVIAVINKSDLPQRITPDIVKREFAFEHTVSVSALYHQGIDDLRDTVFHSLTNGCTSGNSDIMLCNTRHKSALEHTHSSLRDVLDGLGNGTSPELVSVDLQAALSSLGELTGETTTEDILDSIFSRFCIGK